MNWKELKIRVLIGLIITFGLSIFSYLIASFIMYDFNIANWDIVARGAVGLFGFFMGAFIGTGVAVNIELKKTKK